MHVALQSRAHPKEIMTEVLKVLQELDIAWKKLGNYNVKCRWASTPSSLSRTHSESNIADSPMNTGSEPFTMTGNHLPGGDQPDGVEEESVVKFEVQVRQLSRSLEISDKRLQPRCVDAVSLRPQACVGLTVLFLVPQLYKMREEKYLLDIQRIEGPYFLFLDLCANFLAELRLL